MGRKITAIEVQKKKPHRRSIYLDDRFFVGVDEEIFIKHNLRVGTELSDKEINQLLYEAEFSFIKEKALHFIKFRERSRKEVLDKLKREKFDRSLIEDVISFLEERDIINDERFAYLFAKDRVKRRGIGLILLKKEMFQKGLSAELIEITTKKIYEEFDQRKLIRAHLKRKMSSISSLPPPRAKKRVIDMLYRRGFSWDLIEEALNSINFRSEEAQSSE
ncbi:MAG: RecX family transcriptional regulator [Fidelibacterota bacterium]